MQAASVIPHDSIPAWRLELLGGANLFGISEKQTLERKAAAILALLAFEGDITRSRVAGLLWADNDEERARANLRQCLYRLKKLTGVDLVQNGERLALTAALEVDTITLESKAFLGDDAGLIAVRGEILAQLDFEDCPEFEEWLTMQRERWRNARVSAYRRVLKDLKHHTALEWATGWVQLDPISEEASRVLAQVYQAQNNRSLALQTLQNLEMVLKQELGASLSSQTLALRDSLERDEKATSFTPILLPKGTLSPSQLVGRETEWLGLERVWAANSTIVIRGVPGIGKSRLINDFLNTKGKFDLIEARPGDTGVAMSSLARGLRKMMNNHLELPDWASLELSRVIPELSNSAAPAINSEADKLRFFEAIFLVFKKRFLEGTQILVLDDLQFIDAASLEALQFQLTRLQELGMKTVLAYRIGELIPEIENQIETAALNGLMEIIELQPLGEEAFAKLTENLKLEIPPHFAAKLQHSTNGNPLFALETIRYLLEQNALGSNTEKIPLPKMVRQITAQRLERRSINAQRIAQVAAVAGTDFTLELAAFALERKVFDLEASLNELEEAQIMHGERFAHDLLLESVSEKIGSSVKRFLHRRCAEFLEATGEPARVANHWLGGGEEIKAVPYFKNAAEKSKQRFRIHEAAAYYRQAGQILERQGQRSEAFKTFADAQQTLNKYDIGEPLKILMNDMERLAQTPDQKADVAHVRAEYWINQNDFQQAFQVAEQGLKQARASGNHHCLCQLEGDLGTVYFLKGQSDKALAHLKVASDHAQKLVSQTQRDTQGLITARLLLTIANANLALALEQVGDYQQAEQYHRQTLSHLKATAEQQNIISALSNFAINLSDQGRFREAREILEQALQLLELREDDGGLDSVALLITSVDIYLLIDEYMLALPIALQSLTHAKKLQDPRLPLSYGRLAQVWQKLGQTQKARDCFHQALQGLNQESVLATTAVRQYAVFLHDLGEDTTALHPQLETALNNGSLIRVIQVQLLFALIKNPTERKFYAQKVLNTAKTRGMNGIVIAAHTRLAAALLDLEQPKKALIESRKAMQLLEQFDSEIGRGEVLWTHYRALTAASQTKAANEHLNKTWAWLEGVTKQIAPEYQPGFLKNDPVNCAILAAAKTAKLEIGF